jgi:hypothetical protein
MIRQKSGKIIMMALGRLCGVADRIDLLHDQGGHRSFDQMSRRGMGQARNTVNAVAPTFINTPGTEAHADAAFRAADTLALVSAAHGVAGAVVFWHPRCVVITGETILIVVAGQPANRFTQRS